MSSQAAIIRTIWTTRTVAFAIGMASLASWAQADDPALVSPAPIGPVGVVNAGPDLLSFESSNAYPNGTFNEQLASAAGGAGADVGGSRHRTGPGRRDDWKVGPQWRVDVDGVVLFREGADLEGVLGALTDPPAGATEFQDNFDYSAGARLLATGEWPHSEGYELQIGYVGVEDWTASAFYPLETIAAPGSPGSDIDVNQRRAVEYDSSLHSLELNFQRATRGYLKPFAGVRYFSFDEDIRDRNDQFATAALPDPPAGVGNRLTSIETDTANAVAIDNDMIGFQLGLRLDTQKPSRRFYVTGACSAGVYVNLIDRDTIFEEQTHRVDKEVIDTDSGAGVVEEVQTTITDTSVSSIVAADGTNAAFATEAMIAGGWRLNNTLSLRGGYQMLFLSGVEFAEDLWIGGAPVDRDHFLHGWFAGLEYRR